MATYLSGNVRKATDNSREAARRSAQSRRCPGCGRGAALVRRPYPGCLAECRWCGWARHDWDDDFVDGQWRSEPGEPGDDAPG